MNYSSRSPEERKQEVNKFFEDVKKEINNYTVDEKSLKELLDWQQKFYAYSLGNTILINQQFRGADAVGSFSFWNEHGYSINKGEKGIKILAPCQYSDYILRNNPEKVEPEKIPISRISKQEKEKIDKGELEVYKGATYYKVAYVYDISQTNCPNTDIPKLFPNRWIEGEIKDYNVFLAATKDLAKKMNVTILDKPLSELGAAKGVSYTNTNSIALNPRNSEIQNAKTILHELAHQKLHGSNCKLTRPEKEFQAELTAYTVCKHFGIDTSEYSIKYLHDWTKNHKDILETQKLLTGVSQAARYFMDQLMTEPLLSQKMEQAATESIYNKNEVKQIDRMKNVPFHIYQNKATEKHFIGRKKSNGNISKISADMSLADARSSLKKINNNIPTVNNARTLSLK